MKSIIFEIKEVCYYLIVLKLPTCIISFREERKYQRCSGVHSDYYFNDWKFDSISEFLKDALPLHKSVLSFKQQNKRRRSSIHWKNDNIINCLIWTTEYINYFMLNRNLMIGDFMWNFTRKKISLKVAWFYNISTASVVTAVCCCL